MGAGISACRGLWRRTLSLISSDTIRRLAVPVFASCSILTLTPAPVRADPPPFVTITSGNSYRFYVEQETVKPGREFTVMLETATSSSSNLLGFLYKNEMFADAYFQDLDYEIDHGRTELLCANPTAAFSDVPTQERTAFRVGMMIGNCGVRWHATLSPTAEPGIYDGIAREDILVYYRYIFSNDYPPPTFSPAAFAAEQGLVVLHEVKPNAITVVADELPTAQISDLVGPVSGKYTAEITLSDFSDDFTVDDLTLSNATASMTGAGKDYVVTLTPDAGGPVSLLVAAGTFSDPSDDFNAEASNTVTAIFDVAPPTVAIAELTGPVAGDYTAAITLSEDSTDFTLSDLTLTNAMATLSGSGSSYTAVLTPIVDGAVALSVAAGTFSDAAGNLNTASNTVTTEHDATAPTVTIATTAANVSVADTFEVTVSFSETVTGFDAGDIAVTNGSVTNLSGGGADYLATITVSGSGDIEVSVPAAAAEDAAGNTSQASNTLSISSATVAETQKVIAQFIYTRANQLISHQPNLTAFLSGDGADGFDASATRGAGAFSFATMPDARAPVWFSLHGSWTEEDASETQYVFGVVGRHFAVSDNLLLGGMIELDYLSQEDGQARIEGTGWLAGPYFVARTPGHPLFVDGRLLYGQTRNDISPLGTYTDSFDTERLLAQFGVSGALEYDATTLMPSLQLSYATDEQEAYTDSFGNTIPAQEVELGQVALGFDIRHAVPLSNRDATLALTGGVAAIGSSSRGSGNADLVVPAYEGGRGRLKLGVHYSIANGGQFVLDTFYDGIGTSGYESRGLQLGFNLIF